jgi:hypothetical protein
MKNEAWPEKWSGVRSLAALQPGEGGTYHRLKRRFTSPLLVCVLVASMVGVPTLANAQYMSGTLDLLGMGPGWYSGATRVTSFLVSRAGVTEIANVALSATIRGGLAGAVIMAMVVAEPAFMSGVDAIRTYMNSLGASLQGGSLYWTYGAIANTGPDMFIPGSQQASDFATAMAAVNARYAGYTWAVGTQVYPSYSAATTAEGTWYTAQGGYGYASENWSVTQGTVACSVGLTENHSTGTFTGGVAFCGPVTAGAGVETNNNQTPPVAVTPTNLDLKITNDITAGSAQATAAADEAEDILHKGIPGVMNPAATPTVTDQTSAPPFTGTVVDTTIAPTPTTGATTPGAEAANVAAANLPSSGAITSTPPAAGTSTATTNDQAYTDPAYSGGFTAVPWATPVDFGVRWNTFATSVQTSGLFALWGNSFGSPGSGGSSTYTFNAGVFGNHTYDFSTWGSTVFGLLSGLVQISCGFVGVKIACLSGKA